MLPNKYLTNSEKLVWYFSALYPLTFKTTISLLFPIQKKTTSSSRTSNCHRGIRAVEQGYLLKHTTEKVCVLDPNRALIYLITCCKNLSSSQPANFTPSFSRAMATEGITVCGDRRQFTKGKKMKKLLFYWHLLSLSKETFKLKAEASFFHFIF